MVTASFGGARASRVDGREDVRSHYAQLIRGRLERGFAILGRPGGFSEPAMKSVSRNKQQLTTAMRIVTARWGSINGDG